MTYIPRQDDGPAAMERAKDALQYIDPHNREIWLRMGMALKSEFGEAGFAIWDDWSQTANNYNQHDAMSVWRGIKSGGGVGIGSLFHLARENGWRDDVAYTAETMTPEKVEERRQARIKATAEAEEQIRQEQVRAAKWAVEIWHRAEPVTGNPYLDRKQVSPTSTLRKLDAKVIKEIIGYPLKSKDEPLTDDVLVVPMRRVGSCALSSLEFIDGTGRKTALAGRGTKSGAYWATERLDCPDMLLVGEGVATVLSASQAAHLPGVAALSCGNLKSVALAMREQYPNAKIIMLADLDNQTGQADQHAIDAAAAVDGYVAVPDFGQDRESGQTDFNDLRVAMGPDAVRACTDAAQPAADHPSDWDTDSGQTATMGAVEWPDPAPLEYRPRSVPEFDAKTLLPEALCEWIVDEAGRMPGPVEFPAVAAIVSLGALIGTKTGIRPKQKDNWLELPNLWGAACGVPSTKKTPSLTAGAGMLFRLAAEESERFEREQKEFQDLLTVGEIEQAEIKKQLTSSVRARLNGDGDADEQAHIQRMKETHDRLLGATPTKRRYHTTDSTGAKLGDLLVNNPIGLMVFRDELGGLLSKLDHPDNAEERGFYLEGFGGKSGYAIDRMERGELWVPNVCLSVLGGIQPDKLAGYMNRAFRQAGNDGLLQRFGLLVYPEPVRWKYVDRYPDKAAKDRAWSVFQKLNDFDPLEWGAMPPDDFCRFCRFGFDDDAQKIFIEWLGWLQNEILANEENPNLEEHFTKYQKLVPALALIFHLVDCADSGQRGPVGVQSIVRAAAWSELLMDHARKAYGLLMDAGLSGAVALSKKIQAGAVQSGFSARDVHVKGWSGLTEIETVKAAIEVLVNEGWLRPAIVQTGGRKKDAFEINPKLTAVSV